MITQPFDHICSSVDGRRFVQFRYFDEIVNMELLEGEGADDVRETACALHLQEVQGVPFYVCLDGFGDIFALAE